MTKKEYILKLLGLISPNVLPISGDIKLLIEEDQISDELIDALILIFKTAVKTTSDQIEKEKLEKGISFLASLKQKEEISRQQDQDDIEKLLNQI